MKNVCASAMHDLPARVNLIVLAGIDPWHLSHSGAVR